MQVDENLKTLGDCLAEFRTLFKGIHTKHNSWKNYRRKKENSRKSAKRKQKRFTKNVEKVYNVCVKNPFIGEALPKILAFPPAVIIPKQLIDVESVSQLSIRDAPQIAHLLKVTALSNGSASRIVNNLKQHVQDKVYEVLYPEEYRQHESECMEEDEMEMENTDEDVDTDDVDTSETEEECEDITSDC